MATTSNYGAVPQSSSAATSNENSSSERPHRWRTLSPYQALLPRRTSNLPASSSPLLRISVLFSVAAAACFVLFYQLYTPTLKLLISRPSTSDPTISTVVFPSIPIDISRLFNNIAAGPGADFDPHSHGSYEAELLPTDIFSYNGVKYLLPSNWSDGRPDNVVTKGETILLENQSQYIRELNVLYAGDWIDGENNNVFTLNFEDGTRQHVELSAKNWWTLHWLNQGVIRTPYHYESGEKNWNLTQIYEWSAGVKSDSALVSINLPNSSWPNHFHLFALTLLPPAPPPRHPATSFRTVKQTTQWKMIGDVKAYAAEITLVNAIPSHFASDPAYWVQGPLYVFIGQREVRTLEPGIFARIMPSDEIRVKVWLNGRLAAAAEDVIQVQVVDPQGAVHLSGTYDTTESLMMELSTYSTPEWWDEAKFGIFIHWGLYSIPAWAPPGWYAAWYFWWMHKWPNPTNGFWNFHRENYGEDVVYDDFIDMFNPVQFNASEWIDLFADSGAKYFVLVTKHHDGFALFDTKNSTHRSSYHLGPKRDYIRELFDASKEDHPDMKRGTYISMPEWYNPDAGKGGYGFGDWPGDLPTNAYDNETKEPYIGRLPGKDYLRDIQLEHMKMLAYDYETELMWCDIGGPNLTREFVDEWYPWAETQGRQVVINNRCGDLPQFDTPEYARFSSIQTVKWETSEGIDPYCYAYNRDTKPEQYKSAATVLHSLIDIVSKNGNYLIGLGPTGEGTFPKPVVERMLEVGRWLAHSGDCIYKTKYFFPGAEHGQLRFTQTDFTFCIISLERPQDGKLEVDTHIPVMEYDTISLLGGGKKGENLEWHHEGRKLVVNVPETALDEVDLAWAFKVSYGVVIPTPPRLVIN